QKGRVILFERWYKRPRAARTQHIDVRVYDLARQPASRVLSSSAPEDAVRSRPFLAGDIALVS
ncbi:MAG TPA: hypothetical protein VIF02_07665, partial [Methylocella sp.]